MEYAIETFSLTKVFSDWWGREKVRAVDELDLRIRYNEVFGLLGPNGSGKTTTLKMLLGLLYPTKGRAVMLGGDSTDPKISSRIGFLPEESYLYEYLNARETLDFYGRLFGLPRDVRRMRIEALLDMVGLKAVANRPVGTFSKGMARRIGLAQALINDPDLLVLDEPTTGLDPMGTRQIKDLILELAKRGKTILLCSHLLADVEDVCDRIAILYGGRVQAEGGVKELLQRTGKRQITTDGISEDVLKRIRQIVEEEGATCAVASPMDKLETFFIETVTAAEEQAQPTSGAASRTHISDFLAGEKPAADILEKLVGASLTQEEEANEPAASETTTPVEPSHVHSDDGLLRRLAEPVEPAKTEPISEPERTAAGASDAASQEKVEHDILDQLAGRSAEQDEGPRNSKDRDKEADNA